jgi:pyruvate,orthophosphate dikinase
MDNPWFAWDNYRRFLQCYGMAFGLARDDFDAIIADFKSRLGIPLKKGFTGEQMKMVALAYKARITGRGCAGARRSPGPALYDDQRRVLLVGIPRAETYRKIMGISDDWGTAVTVQEMVFGNISPQAGAGVFFTHNPRWSGDTLSPWGDFSLENQGEDVVAGLVRTLPISVKQQEIEMRDTDITLETHYPASLCGHPPMGGPAHFQKRLEPPGDGIYLRRSVSRRHLPAPNPGHGHPGA